MFHVKHFESREVKAPKSVHITQSSSNRARRVQIRFSLGFLMFHVKHSEAQSD